MKKTKNDRNSRKFLIPKSSKLKMENKSERKSNEIESLVNQTLESLDSIQRAGHSPEFTSRLESITRSSARIIPIQSKILWRIAACLAILIGLNVLTILYKQKASQKSNYQADSFTTEYFSYLKSI
jgi:hypothetical protein